MAGSPFPSACTNAFRDIQNIAGEFLRLMIIQGSLPYIEGQDLRHGTVEVDDKPWTWLSKSKRQVGNRRQFLLLLVPTVARKKLNSIYRQWRVASVMAGRYARSSVANLVSSDADDADFWCLALNDAADRGVIPCDRGLRDPEDMLSALGVLAGLESAKPKYVFYDYENIVLSSIALCTLLERGLHEGKPDSNDDDELASYFRSEAKVTLKDRLLLKAILSFKPRSEKMAEYSYEELCEKDTTAWNTTIQRKNYETAKKRLLKLKEKLKLSKIDLFAGMNGWKPILK